MFAYRSGKKILSSCYPTLATKTKTWRGWGTQRLLVFICRSNRALSAVVFTVAMDVSGLPSIPQRARNGWGTRSCVNTQLENAVNAQNAAPIGAAFWGPALPLASQNVVAGGFFHRTYCRHPRPVHPFLRAASLAVALAGRLLFLAVQSSEAAATSLAPI